MKNDVKGKVRKQITLSINSRKVVIESLLSPDGTEILDVIVKFNGGSLESCHLTYHKDDKRVTTHVREENTSQRKQGRKFINFGSEDYSSTVWISSSKTFNQERVECADIYLETTQEFFAYRFCVTPTDKIIESVEEVYSAPDAINHPHIPFKNYIAKILSTKLNELEIELLETCCRAIKRERFDITKRNWSSVTQEFGTVDNNGVITIRLMTPTSIFENN